MFLQLLTGLSFLEVVLGASCDKKFTSSSGGLSLHSSLSNQECQYDILGFYGKGIRLTWSSFNVKGKMPDCSDDYVEIFVGCDRHSIGKYCSENSNKPFDIYAQQACLRLKIRSYRSSSFYATYSSFSLLTGSSYLSDSCFLTKTMYDTSEVINSPRWPRKYPSSKDCFWKIEVGSRKGVKIAFMDLDLEYDDKCEADKVKVKGGQDYESYDSSSTIRSSMCSTKTPFFFTSTNERIWIRFKSDNAIAGRGFIAGYVTYDLRSGSSGGSSGSVVAGIVVGIVVLIVFAGCIFYIFVYRRRLAKRQNAQQQAMVQVPPQQTGVQRPPPPPQPGYGGPPPPAGHGGPPPAGYAPPSQPGYAPPPYSQAVPAPYPQQDKATAYPPAPQGGAPPYPPGQPGAVPPYPPEQPGGAPPGGTSPYPTTPPGGAPYPPQ